MKAQRDSAEGGHQLPVFVAEVSSNHHHDLGRCLAFIDKAAEIGCDAVKFQLFKIRELFAPEILERSAEHRLREAWELPVEFLPDLAARCREKNILFGCTPFYLDAVKEMLPYVDFLKVASYELLWDDLLRTCSETRKPLVLSTGMATMAEIRHAVDVIVASLPVVSDLHPLTSDCRSPIPTLSPLTLLHCVSGYPTPVDQCNLAAMQTLRDASASDLRPPTSVQVGWSDHSANPDVLLRAVEHWHASMVEFHLDLDGDGEEYGSGHCWLPEEIGPVIAEVQGQVKGDEKRNVPSRGGSPAEVQLSGLNLHPSFPPLPMDGDGTKEPVASELPDREWRADPADGLRPFRHIRNAWRVHT